MPLFFLAIRRILPAPQRQKWWVRSRIWFGALWLLSVALPAAAAQPSGTLAGQVVDARTGAPLEKVLVVVEDTGQSATSAPDGGFLIAGLSLGHHRLYVSVVGYALFRQEVTVGSDP